MSSVNVMTRGNKNSRFNNLVSIAKEKRYVRKNCLQIYLASSDPRNCSKGRSVGARNKRRRKFSKTGGRASPLFAPRLTFSGPLWVT